MKSELRVALLGTGFMGKAHSNAYCQAGHFFDLPYRLRRTLLCDVDQAALAATAGRWEWEDTATDWQAAIDRKDIDVVDIALPNHLHAPAAIAAARAGKIVLCEKPLAISVSEAREMVAAAKNVPNKVWFNYRRLPAIAFAKEIIAGGRLGTIFHYNAAYLQQWGADTTRGATWRMNPALAGSGAAGDLLTHCLDTALFLNGSISSVSASARTLIAGRGVDDAFMSLVHFENGSAGMFEASRFGIGYRNAKMFQIHGAAGMLRFNLERLNHLEFVDAMTATTEQGPRDLLVTDPKHPIFGNFWRPGHIIGWEHTFIASLAAFLESLSRGEEFHPNFEDGLRVQLVLDAMQRSAETRQWVTMS